MEDFDCPLPISTLICHEPEAFSIDGDYEMKEKQLVHLPDLEEYIEILVTKENTSEITNIQLFHSKWLRSEAIQWILKMKDCFGFSPQTVYQAVSYFDRFLMRRSIHNEKSWVVQLLSVACLSLAAKMEEVMAPPLMEYQTENCYFDATTIQRMELFVLNTLEWRMSSVSPHVYLSYFINKFCGNNFSKELLSKSIGFILPALEEINLVEFRASVIAAAAVLTAFDQKLTRQALESKMKSVSFVGLMETDLVYSCYKLMAWKSKKRSRPSNSSESSVIDNLDEISDCGSASCSSSRRKKFKSQTG